jgi:hypothetical protein
LQDNTSPSISHNPIQILWARPFAKSFGSCCPLRKCTVPFLHAARYPLPSLARGCRFRKS